MKKAYLAFFLLSQLLFASINSYAEISLKMCLNEAKTELERSYCDIVREGYGNRLPDFHGFKRNNPQTQYLLLKPLAKRAGIELPKTNGQRPNATPPAPITNTNTTEINSNKKKTDFVRNPLPNKKDTASKKETDLSGCSLQNEEIACVNQRYFLTINVPLDRLPEGSLALRNRLIFPPRFQSQTDIQYLSEIYPYYIEKMLLIGLGDSTMSFTKFSALHEEAKSKGENFSKRFDDMYELLKIERQSMGIKDRYRNNFPENMEQCMRLNSILIACDNVEQNWIYRKLAQ